MSITPAYDAVVRIQKGWKSAPSLTEKMKFMWVLNSVAGILEDQLMAPAKNIAILAIDEVLTTIDDYFDNEIFTMTLTLQNLRNLSVSKTNL